MDGKNPLIDDELVDFLLYEVLDATALTAYPTFEHHSRETFDLFLAGIRRFARKDLVASYKPMDEEPPRFEGKRIHTHPLLPGLWKQMVELGIICATRPDEVGGVDLPLTLHTMASAYLMAANPAVYGYAGLTLGAAHLIEAFGSEELKSSLMTPMYEGKWSGTMALTEPQAGSSLGDITTTATPSGDHHLIRGSKIFISGGDQQATDNIVHLTLARIEGAPAGSRGISLFAIPARRVEDGALVDNDVTVAGMIHKIGWKGLPSLALEFGDRGDCQGHLVGEPNQGLRYMFQMMNEARIMVGVNGAATASAAYHEARTYAIDRLQGRPIGQRDGKPVSIIEHADVRRMLLRQKAIVEGSFALLATASRYSDVAEHCGDEELATRSRLVLDALTPIAKTFPAEFGFEANALAVQVHGGYGYSSEYLVESYMRDQKLNSLHEGTTGIQSLDLLGRKAFGNGGASIRALLAEIASCVIKAEEAGVEAALCSAVSEGVEQIASATAEMGAAAMRGEPAMARSVDYLTMVSILVVGWQWLAMASAAQKRPADDDRRCGTIAAAQYWIRTEVPRIALLASLCTTGERSYVDAQPSWF